MIKNCFNYVGSKDRILHKIIGNSDYTKETFIDLFCGSGVVGINVADMYKRVILNDACWQIARTLEYFKENDYHKISYDIEEVISDYSLSKNNKEGYDRLRNDYNEHFCKRETFKPQMFYCLLTHSFNYNIHINSSGGFSVPFGKNRSSFNNTLRNKFRIFQGMLHACKGWVSVQDKDFVTFIDKMKKKDIEKSMFYCDPPYLSSDSSYGRIHYLGRWDGKSEQNLCDKLDYINDNGGSFLLSNVFENNGKRNEILIDWARKYNVIYVNSDYANCNYQRKNLGETKEVIILNTPINKIL